MINNVANADEQPRKKETFLPALIAVSKRAAHAIRDFDLIHEGDKIAVAVSGGKDSLSLMHVLRHRQRISPVKFEFAAVHVDFEFSDFDPQRLIDYFEKENFSYIIEKVDYLKGQKYEDIDCYWWSKNRRKALFQVAEKKGFNKIAFGHHMDDIVETIILNQFYRGEVAGMKPNQVIFGGKLAMIRPLAYVREQSMEYLAQQLGIASMGQSKCANDDTSHRMVIKGLLREMQKHNPDIVTNIFRSLSNVRIDYLLQTVDSPDPIKVDTVHPRPIIPSAQ